MARQSKVLRLLARFATKVARAGEEEGASLGWYGEGDYCACCKRSGAPIAIQPGSPIPAGPFGTLVITDGELREGDYEDRGCWRVYSATYVISVTWTGSGPRVSPVVLPERRIMGEYVHELNDLIRFVDLHSLREALEGVARSR